MTIAHIVLTQWRPGMPAATLAELSQLTASFPADIPGVLSVVEGPSISTEGLEAGYEWGMVVTFADAAARDAYLPHAAHAPVAALIGEWAERLVVLDVAA